MNAPSQHLNGLAQARTIARDAYVYGFPLVDNYRILHSYFVNRDGAEFKAPWNELHHEARVFTPFDRAIQTPNSDTPYSQLGADLRAEPLVLSFPAIETHRYYSAQLIDLYTHNFAYVGTRATGNAPGHFLLAGPSWKGEKPAGIKAVLQCETELAFVFYRTQMFGPDDLETVKKIQTGYQAQPLSVFLGTPPPPQVPALAFPAPLSPQEERASLEFFELLNFVLQLCPLHPSEKELMARFAWMGVGPGGDFDEGGLSRDLRRAVEEGVVDAWRDYADAARKMVTGELTSADLFGTRAFLRNDYLRRMLGAVDGIYGNSREEAYYPGYLVDATGQRLDGSRSRYTLHFAPGQLPPANAFWSLTMYRLPARMLVANPLDRYLINSAMLPDLKRDADGGLTIHVQHKRPSNDTNWLPAPDGPFLIGLRLYWPKPEAYNGGWKPPALRRVKRDPLIESLINKGNGHP